MTRLNRYVLTQSQQISELASERTVTRLGLCFTAFLIAGFMIYQFFPIPRILILIDRSYCPQPEWGNVVQAYSDLYHQYQLRRLKFESVILFSDLGEEVFSEPPLPETIKGLNTYGRSNSQRQTELEKTYPQVQVLSCSR